MAAADGKRMSSASRFQCCAVCTLAVLVLVLAGVLSYFTLFADKRCEDEEQLDGVKQSDLDDEDVLTRALYMRWQMNESADPCQDFYQYACGGIEQAKPFVTFKTSWISEIDQLSARVSSLLGKPAKHEEPDAVKMAKTFFQSCRNRKEIEKKGVTPLKELLMRSLDLTRWEPDNSLNSGYMLTRDEFSGRLKDRPASYEDQQSGQRRSSLTDYLVKVRSLEKQPLVSVSVRQDLKDHTQNILYVDQPQMNLDRHVYANSTIMRNYRNLFVGLTRVFFPKVTAQEARIRGEAVVKFERKLAGATLTLVEQRNYEKFYEKVTIKELSDRFPFLNWLELIRGFFKVVHVNDPRLTENDHVVSLAMPYLDKLLPLLSDTDFAVIEDYCLWTVLYGYSPYLSLRASTLVSSFKSSMRKIFTSVDPTSKFCESLSTLLLPQPVGRLYAETALSPGEMVAVKGMIERILHAFKEILLSKDWISERTKQKAVQKVELMKIEVGSPAEYRNDTALNELYRGVNVTNSTFFDNILRIERRISFIFMSKLGKKELVQEWPSSAATVNAFYSADAARVTIPAAILQPPKFRTSFPSAINYGAIGSIIGHELTHGFDAGGRRFDAYGNLRQWWSQKDIDAFKSRATCIVEQYSHFKDKELNINLDGNLTKDENIADNGGMAASFAAFTKLIKEDPAQSRRIPGLWSMTQEQIFFLSFAQLWCSSMRPGIRFCKLHTDAHSLPEYRVIGPLQNNPDFARAFNCPAGSYMNPHKKCIVW